uniref:Uncharacterized protein n=1 Tax=Anguilla anguilla TaxID=7936 RepID=A0A0E9SPX8_ANGAN
MVKCQKRSRTIRVDSLMCGLRKENAALPFSLLTRALSEHAVLGDKNTARNGF